MSTNQRRICGNCGNTVGPFSTLASGVFLCTTEAGESPKEKADAKLANIRACNARRNRTDGE